jgi:hypothetical protein
MPDTCLIIGNGPSLRDVPLDFLRKYDSFGTNKIFLLNDFVPSYYVAINELVVRQNVDRINALPCERYVREKCGAHGIPLHPISGRPFSFTPLDWVNEGYTVTYVCLQLAFWIGYETVLLVGIDHRYKFDGEPNQKQMMGETDPNHFDPSYFAGQEWQNPDLRRSNMFYEIANDVYKRAGRSIVNLTPNTGTNAFEKGEICEW